MYAKGKAPEGQVEVVTPIKPAKVSKLKAVEPKAAEPSKPKILIFGKPGVGKTWASLDFPNCYFLDTEGGANLKHYTDKLAKAKGMYLGIEQGSQDFDTIIDQVKALATEEHSYKTLVIDSLSQLELAEIAKESEKMMREKRDMTKTYGAEKKPAISYTRQLTNWLQRIDMNVIVVCHEKGEWSGDKQIGTTFDGWDKLGHILHLCLNIIKTGESRRALVKKTRLEQFPDASNFAWSYEEFATRYGKEIIEGKVKQLVLATPEQLEELNRLLEVVKLPDGETEKWLKKANAETFADMDFDKVAACINMLKGKVTNNATLPAKN